MSIISRVILVDLMKPSTVFVTIFVRYRTTLPFFLSLFTNLEYPKDRIRVWVYRDTSDDYSARLLAKWTDSWQSRYHSVNVTEGCVADVAQLPDAGWTEDRYRYVNEQREEALENARRSRADYIWFLDSDALLVDPRSLISLIEHERIVVAPVLHSDNMYSNFWCGMSASYYYKRTNEYEEILHRKKIGCFAVPMVHKAVLINLQNRLTDRLTFNPDKIMDYDGPIDDIIPFAVGANKSGVQLHVCNDRKYGYTIVPPDETNPLKDVDVKDRLLNLKLHVTVNHPPLRVDDSLSAFVDLPPKSKFGFDEIFVINLKRRIERKARMEYCLDELGIDASFIDAVDGKSLEEEKLMTARIELMPFYEDPYYKRPMKKGEIGCFLSHYRIWRQIIDKNMNVALILEDDLRFEANFVRKLQYLIREISRFPSLWDFVYIGRKIMKPNEEKYVNGSDILIYPDYSYWTIGYILHRNGAQKLVNAEPLTKLLPVDEFLPIMYDKHPRKDWKAYFRVRNLLALSVNPLLVFPMKYTNEEGYVSDTEDSHVVNEKKVHGDEL